MFYFLLFLLFIFIVWTVIYCLFLVNFDICDNRRADILLDC